MKKTLLVLLLVLCCYSNTLLFARQTISFDNGWLFEKGPFSKDPVLFSPAFEAGWKPVAIPHTWNNNDMQTAKNSYYAGAAYYKKYYDADASLKGKRVFLRFQGVASVADVYVNGQFAGNHKGGYSAFAIEITSLLHDGARNEILVRVDNTPRPDVIPVNNTLFGVYGGIYRPVDLIITDKLNIAVTDYASSGVYLSQTHVSPKQADVAVLVKLENRYSLPRKVDLVTTVYEENSDKVKQRVKTQVEVLPQSRQFFHQQLCIRNPHLWQAQDDPYLYRSETTVWCAGKEIDRVVQPLGLRHYELRGGDGMYLNGKKMPMYGVARHQEWWGKGNALTNKEHATDLAIIQELGATTIRLAHYQQAEYVYAKCDSIGFMVWAEIPFVNKVTTEEADNAKQQLTELIRQNYNHPCIYIWGLHNEVYKPYNYTVALTAQLNDLAKTEDPYRYTGSVNGYGTIDQAVNLNADVQGINRYYGWYEGKVGDLEDWIRKAKKDFPNYKVVISEYGAEANIHQQEEAVKDYGRWFSQFYPETFSTHFHEVQWGIIARNPYLLATYVWNTFDFATPATTQGGVPARNMKGLVTYDRKVKKDAFYWYKANWSKSPVLYLTQRRAVRRENRITPVTVYSNMGVPRLFVNGKQIVKYRMGTTGVHYIFDGVCLREGHNTIETNVMYRGKNYRDEMGWEYSPANHAADSLQVVNENKKEHGGM